MCGAWPTKTSVSDYDQYKLYDQIYVLIKANKLSSTNAKQLIQHFLSPENQDKDSSVEDQASSMDLLQVSDAGEIVKIVDQVLSENAKAAEDVKNGEMKAIGFLVGQVMKNSKGKANPSMAQALIKRQLGL